MATAKQLGIKEGATVLLVHRPGDWPVPDLPVGASCEECDEFGDDVDLGPDVVIAFFRRAADYRAEVQSLADAIFPAASLWAAWPRRAGGHESDLSDSVIRAGALAIGLVDNKVAAIDQDWSGLRLTWRQELRGRSVRP